MEIVQPNVVILNLINFNNYQHNTAFCVQMRMDNMLANKLTIKNLRRTSQLKVDIG